MMLAEKELHSTHSEVEGQGAQVLSCAAKCMLATLHASSYFVAQPKILQLNLW